MPNEMQAFVRGQDGNLWLETGPWGDVAGTIQRRLQVDGSVSQVFDQVGGSRIWRPAFQPLSAEAIYVLGSDGNLWFETAPQGANGAQWGDVASTIATRQQVDGSVQAFQVMDAQTLFVLGNDGNLWFETAPDWGGAWGNVAGTIANRLQVDGDVMQFWATGLGTVFVLGNDLNLWLETGPWGDVGSTIQFRVQIDANANDLQPLDENTVFVLGHDGNLWLEVGRPFIDVAHTIAARSFVASNVLVFGALTAGQLYYVDGDSNLWYMEPPDQWIVDNNVNGCFPLYTPPSLFG
jgi:hypothetical protein